jgi:hypothetical protein
MAYAGLSVRLRPFVLTAAPNADMRGGGMTPEYCYGGHRAAAEIRRSPGLAPGL